jgi:hypothetical protein
MLEMTIIGLMDDLGTADDGAVQRVADKLHKLRLLTAGSDRELVNQAIQECRDLLSPGGRLRRAVALAAQQQTGESDAA